MPWDENPEKKSGKQPSSPWESQNEGAFNASKKSHKQNNADDLFNIFSKNFNKLNNQFTGQPNLHDKKFLMKILLGIVLVWLASGIYQIQEGEEAVVLRFGKYVRTSNRGLNYHIPAPIEEIIKEKTGLIRRENSTDIRKTPKTYKYGETKISSSNVIDNLVLTGDENILDINYVVQWKISNLRDYIFNLQDNRDTVINVCESALREAVGNSTLARAYTDGRSDLEFEVKSIAQEALGSYKAGVEITSFQLMKVDPPAEVIESFREVQNAKADKEREINLAKAHERAVLPEARGVAARIINQAKAYKQEVIERSTGEAKRFIEIYQEYKKAPEVTRKRIYLDTMNKILSGTEKVFINGKNSNGVVPYLPLPELKNK